MVKMVEFPAPVQAVLDEAILFKILQCNLCLYITFMEDLSILDTIFLQRAERKVKSAGAITLEKRLYEVPF